MSGHPSGCPRPFRTTTMRAHLPAALLLTAFPLFGQAFEAERGLVVGLAAETVDIRQEQPLSFGGIAAATTGGTVTISWNGFPTVTGVVPFGATAGPASFVVTITGRGTPHYTITLPASATLRGPGADMRVHSFQIDPSAGRVDPRTQQQVIGIGATLDVNPMQSPGSYEGTYPVTVHLGN